MLDSQLLRYGRQIMLPEFDVAGQQKLLDATVLIIGMGGLGCPAAMYLAAAGVGHLIIADHDTVEITNLQRQIAHSQASLGQLKVSSAKETLLGLNPDLELTLVNRRLTSDDFDQFVKKSTVVIDATDNFSSRFAISRSCVKFSVPLVSGAAIRMEGQVAVFDTRVESSPCYQCLYQEIDDEAASCAENGVMAPIVGIIGSVQAMESIKIISAVGNPLVGKLLLLDANTMQWRELKLPRDANCQACQVRPADR